MARLLTYGKSNMVYWDILVSGTKVNDVFRNHIESINVVYSITEPTQAQISLNTFTNIENFFRDGQQIEIKFGYSRTNMITMIKGRAVMTPNGSAGDYISYTINILDDILRLNNTEKTKIFGKKPRKKDIINQVVAKAGMKSDVKIKDNNYISLKFIPKQIGITDLEFLYKCALKWNCIVWIKDGTVYFYDSDEAHDLGNAQKIKNIEDLDTNYILGYRAKLNRNNVKNLNWKRLKVKSGNKGQKVSIGTDRSGTQTSPSDYEIDAYGQIWVLKPEVEKKIKRNPSLALKYMKLDFSGDKNETYARLREYFTPLTRGEAESTNRNSNSGTKHAGGKFEVIASLNIGDPFLRAPRKALLICGDGTKGSTELPAYLFRDGKKQEYYINKVKTTLQGGMLHTEVTMTMGKK